MRHISEILPEAFAPEDQEPAADEWQEGAPWIGAMWAFDVRCQRCGTVFPNTRPWCPICDNDYENQPDEGDCL